MRIAVIADIHGNLPAFESILEHIAAQHVDRIIIAGDIVNGSPDSDECWRLAQSLGCATVRGNHERYIFDYGTPNADPQWESERFSSVRWAVAQFTQAERTAMAALPLVMRSPELPNLLVTHAAPESDQFSLKGYTPDEQIGEAFGHVPEETIVRGHNHLEFVRHWEGKQIVTVGAAGLPLDGLTTARYSILECSAGQWNNRPQAIPYDVDRAIRRFHESGYLEATYPMGRLFLREVATASHTFIPFLRNYFRWQEDDPEGLGSLSLADAIDHFLNLY